MGRITLQILDGLERGQVLRDLPTPVNIGREEDNLVRLNDERVSRFHAKIQEHEGQFVLTDLESTNGTRVNGHAVDVHVLNIGDQLLIGRCLLVFGSPEEMKAVDPEDEFVDVKRTISADDGQQITDRVALECPNMFRDGPPPLPAGLDGMQIARTADVLAYVHNMLLRALYSVQAPPEGASRHGDVTFSVSAWHRLQALQLDVANYWKQVSAPRE